MATPVVQLFGSRSTFMLAHPTVLAAMNGVVGIAALGYATYLWSLARRTLTWPTVAGTLLRAGVTSSTWRGATSYFVHLEYEYVVGGRTYRSARRAVGGAASESQSEALGMASNYNAGDTVWVFYNPADPADAVLEHASSRAPRIALLGALFLGFAVFLVL